MKAAARSVAAHAEAAMDYFDQAKAGPPDISFLPFYYGLLNIAKIYIVARGRASDLQKEKWHGAKYETHAKRSRDLANERISIHNKGTIPLFYQVLTEGSRPAVSKTKGLVTSMGKIHRRVRFTSTEYREAYPDAKYPFADFVGSVEKSNGGYQLRVKVTWHKDRGEAVSVAKIQLIDDGRYKKVKDGLEHVGAVELGTEAVARAKALKPLRRCLIGSHYDHVQQGFYTFTPLSRDGLLWPEELPILLSFFHLSNVVRYDPEYLERLKDSKVWRFLYALRQNAPLTFLELFWSFLKQRNLVLRRE